MTGQEDRARIRARVGAGTMVWTLTELESDAERFDRAGPHIDHLAQLLRRQRRRQAARQGILRWGSWVRGQERGRADVPARANRALPRPRLPIDEPSEAQWGWLSDGDVRRMLAARDRAGTGQVEVIDLREQPEAAD